jgi:hypothetical protein
VEYCGNCTLPFEFCENYPDYEGCKNWLAKNMPDQFEKLSVGGAEGGGGEGAEGESKRQKRGGKGMVKAKKKEADIDKRIILSMAPRGKKKAVTVVQAVLRIRIHRIHMFLGLPDPDPLVRGMDPDPALDPDPSIIVQNWKKNLDS